MVFIFGHDITELVSLQTLLDNASKLSRMGSWEVDLLNNKLFLSSTTKEIYGLPQDSSPSLDDLLNYYDQETKKTIQAAIDQAIRVGMPWDYQVLLKRVDGKEMWVRSIGKPEFSNGNCVSISGSLQDIHIQKTSEIELAKNNQLLEIISKVIEKFLLVENWKEAIEKVFQLTSETVQIDTINYFQKIEDETNGIESVFKMIEWKLGEDISFTENKSISELAVDDFPEIMDVLKEGSYLLQIQGSYPIVN